jgi:hypothetical protein
MPMLPLAKLASLDVGSLDIAALLPAQRDPDPFADDRHLKA